jgi:hypothetical protein
MISYSISKKVRQVQYDNIDYQNGSRELRAYESVDIIKSRYSIKHGGTLNTTNATAIAMSIRQGRNLLESAIHSDYVDKPVKLYYALTSFMRAEIMYSCRKSESALVNKHGLELTSLPIKCNNISDLLNIDLNYIGGGYSDWHSGTQHSMQLRQGSSAPTTTISIIASIESRHITLISLLRLMPDIWKELEYITGVHIAKLKHFTYDPEGVSIFEGFGDLSEQQIKSYLLPELHASLKAVDMQKWELSQPSLVFEPQLIQGNNGPFGLGDITIGDHNDGVRLTTLGIYVSIAYILSMIARYRPSIWGSIWNLGELDAAQPLLSQVMIEIQNHVAIEFYYSLTK